MKRLAILPARGGSKRIAYKNIKPFHGRPLIAYSLESASESGVFDTIHVSTDDEKIFNVCTSLGHEPDFMRPEALAGDMTPIFEVLKSVIKTYQERGESFDTICLIYPTAALIKAEHLQEACAQFESSSRDKFLLGVAELPCPVEWAYRKDEETNTLYPVQTGGFSLRSQDLKTAYYDAAMFNFFTYDLITQHKLSELDQHCAGFVLPNEYVTDIDTPENWTAAEAMYKALRMS